MSVRGHLSRQRPVLHAARSRAHVSTQSVEGAASLEVASGHVQMLFGFACLRGH